jgi:hypothetical protein
MGGRCCSISVLLGRSPFLFAYEQGWIPPRVILLLAFLIIEMLAFIPLALMFALPSPYLFMLSCIMLVTLVAAEVLLWHRSRLAFANLLLLFLPIGALVVGNL